MSELKEKLDRLLHTANLTAREWLRTASPLSDCHAQLNNVTDEDISNFRSLTLYIKSVECDSKTTQFVLDHVVSRDMWLHSSDEDKLTCLLIVKAFAESMMP